MSQTIPPASGFFNTCHSLFAVLDARGCFVQLNDAWFSLLGYPRSALLNRSYLPFIHAQDRHYLQQIFMQIAQDQFAQCQVRLRHEKGHDVTVLWQWTWSAAQQCCHCVGIVLDGMPISINPSSPDESIEQPLDLVACSQQGKSLWQRYALASKIIANLSVGVCLTNQHGVVLCMNPAFEALFGYDSDALLGQPFSQLFPDYLQAQVDQALLDNVHQASSQTEWEARYSDGALFDLELVSMVLEDVGEIIEVHLAADITLRKQALRRLQQSESRLKLTIENLPIMVDALDEKGHIVLWNQECERVTGYSADELLGNPDALSILYPDQRYHDRALHAINQVINDDPGYRRGEWMIRCKSGKDKVVAWSVNSNIKIAGYAVWGIGEDVSERDEARLLLQENKLRLVESERQLSEAVSKLPIMISALDEAGNIVFWNACCEQITGYVSEEVLHNPQALEWLYPDKNYRQTVLDSVRQVLLKQNESPKQQWLIRCASGEQKLISWSVNCDLHIPNFATWWVGEDISQREQALKQLRENEQQLRLLIENMPIMLLAFDKQAKIVMWNRQCEVVTGYSANVILNNPDALSMLYPQMEYRFYREAPLHRSIGTHWEMELRCVDNRHKIIAWSDASQHMQVAGWEKWLLGEDITLRKRKQQAVSDSHALLSAAMEHLDTGVLISDARQRIVYSNHALGRLYGYDTEYLLDTTLSKLMPYSSQGFVYKHYFSFLNGAHGEYYKEIMEATHQNNSTFLIQTDVHRFAAYKDQNFVIWFISALRPQNFP